MHGKASLLCLVIALGCAAAASNGGQEEGVNNIVDGRQEVHGAGTGTEGGGSFHPVALQTTVIHKY